MGALRSLGLGACALLLCASAGCGPGKAREGDSRGEGLLFGASFQTLDNPVFAQLDAGLREVIEARGDRLVTLGAGWDSQRQRGHVSSLLDKRAAGIFINPVNWEGIKGSLIAARRTGIPVIIVDAPVSESDLVLCQVASDNVGAGRLACRALAQVRPAAKVVILHLSLNKACIDRVAGFKEEMARYPGMEMLDVREGTGTADGARPVMRDLLDRFPQVDACFAVNDPSALGAVAAIESAGKPGAVTVVSVDGSREGIDAVMAGKLHATVAQFPKRIGRAAAAAMYSDRHGEAVPKDVGVPVELITAPNARRFLNPVP